MQFTHLVSIIIPTYNRVDFIPETIESIINQTYPNWEAIIVDDGSTEENFLIIQKVAEQDSRIKLYKRAKEAKGASVCRNMGLELSTGQFVIFLDSDDILAPTCIDFRVKQMVANPTLDFGVFQAVVFKDDLKGKTVLWNLDSDEDDLVRFLRKDALWQTTGAIYNRASLINIGGFDEDLLIWQDYELHTRVIYLALKYKKFLGDAPDFYIRHHQQESISQKGVKRKEVLLCREKILFKFYHELNNRDMLTISRKNALVSSIIVHCRSWINAWGDLQYAKEIWLDVAEKRLVNFIAFHLINIYLTLYSGEKTKPLTISKIVRKLISFMMPHYFDRRTFLNKVPYNINSRTNQ